MRPLTLVALVLTCSIPSFAAEDGPRLEGIAYTEGHTKAIQVQVWALGEQVAEHPEWQFEAVFDGIVAPGRSFSVDLAEARLPVLVELVAEDHVAVSLEVVLPEQLRMPPVWLRRGEPMHVRVSRPDGGNERLVVWGGYWVDSWGWDSRRWRAAVPHLEAPPSGELEAYRPSEPQAMWLIGVGEDGSFGTFRDQRVAWGGFVHLKIDSAPLEVRVWDARKRPVPGVRLKEESSPLPAEVTDDEGRAVVQVPTHGEWKIVALDDDSQGARAGRGLPDGEVDLDLEPRVDVELRWPGKLGAVVIHRGFDADPTHPGPRVLSGGEASLPKMAMSGFLEFWGPGIAPGRIRPPDSTGPLPLPANAPVRIEGRVVSAGDTPVAGLPVWMRISRSAMSIVQRYGVGGRATPLERPWLPWAVTDADGRLSVAGLPPAECEVEVRAPGFPAARSERLEGEPGAVLETTVTLRRGATLSLRVTDPEGAPLAGTTVDLYRSKAKGSGPGMAFYLGGRAPRGDPELTALTDQEGRAVLTAVPVGWVRLRLSRPGSVTRSVDPIEVPEEGVDLGDRVLEPGVTLTGTTVGPDGDPVGESEVALERNPQVPFFRGAATSDGEGRFSIPDLAPSGEVYMQARAEGLVPDAPLKVELPPEGEVEIRMVEERILEGRVLDARDDAPVEGATVHLRYSRSTGSRGSGSYGSFMMSVGQSTTDSSGRFLLDGLWPGEFRFDAVADGMQRMQQTVLLAEADPEPLVIRLEPGLELRGRVETADGDPGPGVSVHASPASQSVGGGARVVSGTQSDADGRFHFDGLGPGTQRIVARMEDGRTARATAEAGQLDEVVLRFARGGVIRGTVFGPDGAPSAGASVSAWNRGAAQSVADESGADGRFELTEVGPGSWTVFASREGLVRTSEEVEVAEGDTVTVDLRLGRGATVIGDVRGLSASELETCLVRVDGGGSASPSGDGAFRIEGAESGERQVIAFETTTRRTRSVGVIVPEAGESDPVVLDFASGLTVGGRVLRGGRGMPGLTLTVHGVAVAASGETVTGPDGEWRVDGLEPGEYQIAALSRSGEVLAGDHVLLEADAEIDLYVPSGSIRGRVLETETERPIEGAAVTVTGAAIPPVRRAAATDAAGAFEVSSLGDGEYQVRAETSGRTPAQETVAVSEGVAREPTLLLEKDTTTVLVVREADGSHPSRIYLTSLGGGALGPSVSSACTAGGRCEIKGLPRGRWTLLIRGEGMALLVADIPRAEVPVQLRAAGTLEVTAPRGEIGAAWRVRLSEAATGIVYPVGQWFNPGRGEWVPVPASGLDLRLPAGEWRIETFAPDGTQGAETATVTAGATTGIRLENSDL